MNDLPLTGPEATLVAIGNAAVLAATGPLDGAKLCLIKDDTPITPDTALADLVAAQSDFTGYAEGAVVWSVATRADDGVIEYLGGSSEFRPTDAVKPQMATGMYVLNKAGTNWLVGCRFPAQGFPMQSQLDSIRVTLRYRPGGDSLAAIIS